MLGGMFGNASSRVVIEEFLSGIECSVFVLTDGKHYQILPEAKDYKRIGEGDTGLNTGGMGSVSPVPFATKEWMQKVEDEIIRPTVDGLLPRASTTRALSSSVLSTATANPRLLNITAAWATPRPKLSCCA